MAATEETTEQATAIQQAAPARQKAIVIDDGEFQNYLDTNRFEHTYRLAQVFAAGELIPQHFRNKPSDCFIAIQMAIRLGVDPFMFMCKTYVVGGKPGMEAQLAIALVNSRGPFSGPIQWELSGEGMKRQATAFATHKVTGDRCECTVSMEIAQAEGWIGKQGSKWKTMPDQMLRYRSAAWLARLYAPECLMGMETVDELQDIMPAKQVVNEAPRTLADKIRVATAEAIDSPATQFPESEAGAEPPAPASQGDDVRADILSESSPAWAKRLAEFAAKFQESAGCDFDTAEDAARHWMGSEGHEAHELGVIGTYSALKLKLGKLKSGDMSIHVEAVSKG